MRMDKMFTFLWYFAWFQNYNDFNFYWTGFNNSFKLILLIIARFNFPKCTLTYCEVTLDFYDEVLLSECQEDNDRIGY